jgi:hypothetical protein
LWNAVEKISAVIRNCGKGEEVQERRKDFGEGIRGI